MRLTVNQEGLATIVNLACQAVPGKQPVMQSLANLLFIAEDKLTIFASDGVLAVRAWADTEIEEEGHCWIHPSVHMLIGASSGEISLAQYKDKLEVGRPEGTSLLATFDTDYLPQREDFEVESSFGLTSHQLKGLVGILEKEDPLPQNRNIYVKTVDDTLWCVAFPHDATGRSTIVTVPAEQEINAVMRSAHLELAQKLTQSTHIEVSKTKVRMAGPGVEVIFPQEASEGLPDSYYEGMKTLQPTISWEPDDYKQLMAELGLCIWYSDGANATRFFLDGGQMTLNSWCSLGEHTALLDGQASAGNLKWRVRADSVLKALKHIQAPIGLIPRENNTVIMVIRDETVAHYIAPLAWR